MTSRPLSTVSSAHPSRASSPVIRPENVRCTEDDQYSSKQRHHSSADSAAQAKSLLAPAFGGKALLIFFTFPGTSLFPKPVGIPAQALIRNLLQITHPMYGPAGASDSVLLPVSIHHIFGTLSMYASLIGGATAYAMSKYSVRAVTAAVEGKRITRLHLTTSMVQTLVAGGELWELSSMRRVVIGGARFDSSIAAVCREKMATVRFQQMYVTTEVGSCCALTPIDCDSSDSVGWPLPGTLFKVVSFDNPKELCQPHQLGHLLCSGPQICPCPYRNSKAVANNSTSSNVDGKFVKTGDAVFYDDRGLIYVMDRVTDIIRYRDMLICPSEVESALRMHPGVEDCAVVGRSPSPYSVTTGSGGAGAQELPAAFIVRSENYLHLTSTEIKKHISAKMERLAEFPGGIYFVAEIPRSVGGRIYRRHLKQFCDRERLMGQVSLDQISTSNHRDSQSAQSTPVRGIQRRDSLVYIPAPTISRLNGVTVKRADVQQAVEFKRRETSSAMSGAGGSAKGSVRDLRASLSQISVASSSAQSRRKLR